MDVYSFGIVAWELLAKREPFMGVPVRELVRLVGRDALRPRVEDAAANGSTALLQLVQACWHQRSEERPRFARVVEHLRAELDTLADSTAVTVAVAPPPMAMPMAVARATATSTTEHDGELATAPELMAPHVVVPPPPVGVTAVQSVPRGDPTTQVYNSSLGMWVDRVPSSKAKR